jgi:hypothetical protein
MKEPSRYRGVVWDTAQRKWQASLQVDGQVVSVGHFDSEHAAAHMYNVAAREAFGPNAELNAVRGLSRGERQRGSGRDQALMRMFPDRARRVYGWLTWNHTSAEIAAIRRFLETGDDRALPTLYGKE